MNEADVKTSYGTIHMYGEKFYDIHIRSIRQMTEQLGLETFILAGLSMGGAIAIGYSLIGDKSKITDKIVNEVWEACKNGNAGKSMQDYQRSSCDKNKAIPFYKNKLSKLEMPIIFVNGEYDSLVPAKHLDGIEEILPNAKVYILEGCRHWSVKEKPEEFFDIVQTNTSDEKY